MNIALLRTDETKSQQGKWIDFDTGVSFLIAASNNPAHARAMSKIAMKRARAQRQSNAAEAEALFVQTLPGNVLLGWKGLTFTKDGAEQEFPFTVENALTLLKESAQIRSFVMAEAGTAENFLAIDEEEAANSLKSEAPVGA